MLSTVQVPRGEGDYKVPGQGYIFVEFGEISGATKAKNALSGRMFDGNTVDAIFYSQDLYSKGVGGV